jgi:hypothetical protein
MKAYLSSRVILPTICFITNITSLKLTLPLSLTSPDSLTGSIFKAFVEALWVNVYLQSVALSFYLLFYFSLQNFINDNLRCIWFFKQGMLALSGYFSFVYCNNGKTYLRVSSI